METLNQLVVARDFEGFRALLTALPRLLAPVSELIGHEKRRWNTLILHSLRNDSSLELIECICETMNDDPQNKSLIPIFDWGADTLLVTCAQFTTRVDVLQFVIDAFPASLLRKVPYGGKDALTTAQGTSTSRFNHTAIVRCRHRTIAEWLKREVEVP